MNEQNKKLTRQNVLNAAKIIDRDGIENYNASTKYDVVIEGKRYPPKEIMRLAHRDLDSSFIWEDTGGKRTNTPLEKLGFEIVSAQEMTRDSKIKDLVSRYKTLIQKEGLTKELYKWELVKKNLGCPNIAAKDFQAEMTKLDMSNLVYQMVQAVIKHLLEKRPEEYRKCLAILYNDNKSLDVRLKSVDSELSILYTSILEGKKLPHHHDERTLSILLTYHNPTKYTFYKESYYMKYCKYLGLQHIKTKGEKYSHYLELITELVSYVSKDKELLQLIDSQMNENCYSDPKHLILAQDILYQYFDSSTNINDNKNIQTDMNDFKMPLNQILYGPPGTGKTYNTINYAIHIIDPSFDLEQDRSILKEEFNRLIQNGSIRFVTFHQSFSYEDFVEGIKPKTIRVVDEKGNKKQDIVYEIEDGVFKQLCITASTSKYNWNLLVNTHIGKNRIANVSHEVLTIEKPRGGNLLIPTKLIDELVEYVIDNNIDFSSVKQVAYNDTTAKREDYPNLEPYMVNGYENLFPDLVKNVRENIKEKNNQNYVLIIDEINRGNIASIFGELITLIEEDKREGGEEALTTILPYSKEKFSVPSNVYILGTMNTADRSVEALDIALRRRFSFIEMAPDTELINFNIEEEDINVKKLVDIINLRIEKLLDKDHRIGHAYFMNVYTLDGLIDVFADKVIPLLEEYFFGDYSKIGLVLGRSFVQRTEFDNNFKFADFDNDDQTDLLDKPIYELTHWEEWDFKSIL